VAIEGANVVIRSANIAHNVTFPRDPNTLNLLPWVEIKGNYDVVIERL